MSFFKTSERASLVYDENYINNKTDRLFIPKSMGKPTENQLVGTVMDNLGELACRICYDSMGYDNNGNPRGRSSELLHKHIKEIINLSVYEHCNLCLVYYFQDLESLKKFALLFLNRKGCFIKIEKTKSTYDVYLVYLSINARAIMEWDLYDNKNIYDIILSSEERKFYTNAVKNNILYWFSKKSKFIFSEYKEIKLNFDGPSPFQNINVDNLRDNNIDFSDLLTITMYLSSSRGWSHEQVRHRYCMSQRSTRYVDEDQSDYVMHDIIADYINVGDDHAKELEDNIKNCISVSRNTYNYVKNKLEPFLRFKGVDKQTARKQSRGAARGYLGNALDTEMLFTAPISGWRNIFKQRLHPAADAEMRNVAYHALSAIKNYSIFSHYFEDMIPVLSGDGIGYVLLKGDKE